MVDSGAAAPSQTRPNEPSPEDGGRSDVVTDDAQVPPLPAPRADALLRVRPSPGVPGVRLVLPEFIEDRVFAGIRTALSAGALLARQLGRPLRVVLLRSPADESAHDALIEWFRGDGNGGTRAEDVTVTDVERQPDEPFDEADVWIVTYWTTAVAAGQACHAGLLDPARIVYLVQDYEPGFFGWSDDAAMAAWTYRQGFQLVVNSRPLARYLEDNANVSVPGDQVFAPALDTAALAEAADRWRPDPGGRIRVLFYGRPDHPRNLFRIGMEALRLWTEALGEGEMPLVRSAGDPHPRYRLGSAGVVEPLGTLSMDAYLSLLGETDLTLALMMSPHPSHLSLEPPLAGIPTVTNRFGTYREPWTDGLHVADADPPSLARALADAAAEARGMQRHVARPTPEALGRPLADAIRCVAERL